MRLHILQHVPHEGSGIIAEWAATNGHDVSITKFFDEEACALPEVDDFDCLVVMGGPMGVNDEEQYPWLVEEKRFLQQALERGGPVLAICLGAQLVASVLGAKVRRNQHTEIGWAPIRLTEAATESEIMSHVPEELEVFHWHGETFEIPEGAVNLAHSAGCRHQGFLYRDNVVGLQFHLEVRRKDVMRMIEVTPEEELEPGTYVQPASKILVNENPFRRSNHAMRGILLKMVGSNADE